MNFEVLSCNKTFRFRENRLKPHHQLITCGVSASLYESIKTFGVGVITSLTNICRNFNAPSMMETVTEKKKFDQ
jgi:hypothetical protein